MSIIIATAVGSWAVAQKESEPVRKLKMFLSLYVLRENQDRLVENPQKMFPWTAPRFASHLSRLHVNKAPASPSGPVPACARRCRPSQPWCPHGPTPRRGSDSLCPDAPLHRRSPQPCVVKGACLPTPRTTLGVGLVPPHSLALLPVTPFSKLKLRDSKNFQLLGPRALGWYLACGRCLINTS